MGEEVRKQKLRDKRGEKKEEHSSLEVEKVV